MKTVHRGHNGMDPVENPEPSGPIGGRDGGNSVAQILDDFEIGPRTAVDWVERYGRARKKMSQGDVTDHAD